MLREMSSAENLSFALAFAIVISSDTKRRIEEGQADGSQKLVRLEMMRARRSLVRSSQSLPFSPVP